MTNQTKLAIKESTLNVYRDTYRAVAGFYDFHWESLTDDDREKLRMFFGTEGFQDLEKIFIEAGIKTEEE